MLKISLCVALMIIAGCTSAPVEPTQTPAPTLTLTPTDMPTIMPTPIATEDPAARQLVLTETAAVTMSTQLATEQQAGLEHTALAQTAVPTLTAAAELGLITRNADWTPVERNFGGIPMVQVPAGCFAMGSENGGADEAPSHSICFFEAYWIDKFEVRQAEFDALDGFATNPSAFQGNNRPVEQITWFEARDYCARRGGRLPTEAEWEYAARGPDAFDYPWGNVFDPELTVFSSNSGGQSTDVGTKPGGASWVGAQDMSGNVWEWTSSLYAAYPYDAADGREVNNESASDQSRVLRGGAWNVSDPVSMRAAARLASSPVTFEASRGMRCLREP